MKPIKFEEVNIVFAQNQPEYIPIPAFKIYNDFGEVIMCWKLTLKERVKLLLTGRLWVSMLTFNKPLTPSFITVEKDDVISYFDENDVVVKKDPLWCRVYEKITGTKIPEYNKEDYK